MMSNFDVEPSTSDCVDYRTRNGDFHLDDDRLKSFSNQQFIELLKERQFYVSQLQDDLKKSQDEKQQICDREQQLRSLLNEAQQRERILIRKLAVKEQEMQDFICQLSELKSNQCQESGSSLHATLLDPSVNLIIEILQDELKKTKIKVEDTQSELTAWKFTPDSNTGKRLMAKCRLLYQENEELGKLTNSGRIAKLEGELALQKSFSDEVKKSQLELDEFLQDLDEDVEGMQSTIYLLQQELRTAKESQHNLQNDYNQLKNTRLNGTVSSCSSVNNSFEQLTTESGHERTSKSLSSHYNTNNKNISDISTNCSSCDNKNGSDYHSSVVKRTRNNLSGSESEPEFPSSFKHFKDESHPQQIQSLTPPPPHEPQPQHQHFQQPQTIFSKQDDTMIANNNDNEDDDDALIISTNGCDVTLSED